MLLDTAFVSTTVCPIVALLAFVLTVKDWKLPWENVIPPTLVTDSELFTPVVFPPLILKLSNVHVGVVLILVGNGTETACAVAAYLYPYPKEKSDVFVYNLT